MKKKNTFLLLLSCLLLCSCSTSTAPDDDILLNEPVEETAPSDEGLADFHCSGSGIAVGFAQLDAGIAEAAVSLLEHYYRSLGELELQSCHTLFSSEEESNRHSAIWNTLIELRKAAHTDLRISEYNFFLQLNDAQWLDSQRLYIEATEDASMRFLCSDDTLSRHNGVIHTFVLAAQEDGSWLIESHDCDDSAYTRFSYDSETLADERLTEFLSDITQRQNSREDRDELSALGLAWDNAYDRQAAYDYMQTYALQRSSAWEAYDDVGGNCQNFGSQVLSAGGIPMDEEGDAQWYWYSHDQQDFSWINVGLFMDYAKANTGFGLVSLPEAAYYTGQVGDILVVGLDGYDHTTVISGLITDEDGSTADYLICSNTGNYLDFPAAAYFYTDHYLVRILGWNN